MTPRKLWIVIPARGGSQEIPRKNLVMCAGKPLIQHVVETSITAVCKSQVVVISDDLEIDWFARRFGVRTVLEKGRSDAGETLDEKILRNVPALREFGALEHDVVATVQPTSPLITPQSVLRGYALMDEQVGSVVSVTAERHLTWALRGEANGAPTPLFEARVNRQSIKPVYRETGGLICARLGDLEIHGSRVVEPVQLLPLVDEEGIDIDTFGDLFEAEHFLTRRKVVIRFDAGPLRGLGHLYRGLSIAQELSRHEVIFVVSGDLSLIETLLEPHPFVSFAIESEAVFEEILIGEQPDLLVLDILDTRSEDIDSWRELAPDAKIVTFEDEGSGADHCDLAVYDLTAPNKKSARTALAGIENSILAPSFELLPPRSSNSDGRSKLLVSFGGTDPAGLTEKVVRALERIQFDGRVTIVTGPGAVAPAVQGTTLRITLLKDVEKMSVLMADHGLAISSMGRTVFELAAASVPVLCFAQNAKEASHVHVGAGTGSVFGGLGFELSVEELADRILHFIEDSELHDRLIKASEPFRNSRSNRKVIGDILGSIGLGLLN